MWTLLICFVQSSILIIPMMGSDQWDNSLAVRNFPASDKAFLFIQTTLIVLSLDTFLQRRCRGDQALILISTKQKCPAQDYQPCVFRKCTHGMKPYGCQATAHGGISKPTIDMQNSGVYIFHYIFKKCTFK